MKKRLPCFLCAVVLGATAALVPAQESHDALFQARALAKRENQAVLLLIRGGDDTAGNDTAGEETVGEETVGEDLAAALTNYRQLGKLIKYEFQLAALPHDSLAAKQLSKKLGLTDLALPLLAALDTDDKLLATLDAKAMAPEGTLERKLVRAFLEKNGRTPLDAKKVLAEGIAEAKKSKRELFVYLSAPW